MGLELEVKWTEFFMGSGKFICILILYVLSRRFLLHVLLNVLSY